MLLPVSFAHLINLEFFDDLLNVLQTHIQSGVSIILAPPLQKAELVLSYFNNVSVGSEASRESPLHPDSLHHPVGTRCVSACYFLLCCLTCQ